MFNLATLIDESQKNSQLIDFEKHNLSEEVLHSLPIQTLYFNLRQSTPEDVALIFPKLLDSQKQALLDLDLWSKDDFDAKRFPFWLTVVDLCTDNKTKMDFVRTEEMVLFLKSEFTISTFDIDEPEYPDHENFFLTDDSLLKIEYNEDFNESEELKRLIRALYAELGVEEAYTYLFKIVNESYMLDAEELYQNKKSRLADMGFVDYFESLDILSPYQDINFLNHYLKENKEKNLTPNVSSLIFNQGVDLKILNQYQKEVLEIEDELKKVVDVKRLRFLKVNFLKFINATLSFEASYKINNLQLTEINKKYANVLKLGLDYVKNKYPAENVFMHFDFIDLCKAGKSLLYISQKKLKTVVKNEEDTFIGSYFNDFVQDSFTNCVKFRNENINNMAVYKEWNSEIDFFVKVSGTINSFRNNFQALVDQQMVANEYYVNYDLTSIDFEALILTALSNFLLEINDQKMGLTIKELKKVLPLVLDEASNKVYDYSDSDFNLRIDQFLKAFGLNEMASFKDYLREVLCSQMEGYDWKNLSFEDYKHVGGPILLTTPDNLIYH